MTESAIRQVYEQFLRDLAADYQGSRAAALRERADAERDLEDFIERNGPNAQMVGGKPINKRKELVEAVANARKKFSDVEATFKRFSKFSLGDYVRYKLSSGDWGQRDPITGRMTRAPEGSDAFLQPYVNQVFPQQREERPGLPDGERPVFDPEGLGAGPRDEQVPDTTVAPDTPEPLPGSTGPVIGEETVAVPPDTAPGADVDTDVDTDVGTDVGAGVGGGVGTGVGTGVGGGVGEGEEAVTTELTAEQQEFFRKQFGGLAFFMEKAELYDIVLQVAREGITDPNRVLGLVQQTDWYQNNSALTRQFDVGYAEEGEAGQRELIDNQYEAINQAARRLGFVIEDERLQELAYQATRLGMDTGEVNDLIAAEQNFDPGYLGDAAKRLASKYYISLDDASADEYGTQLFVGDMTQQTLESMFMEQAKGRFPSLSNIIDSGVSPQTYFAPYKAQIAQLLEIDSNQIDLMNDTRFSTIIDHIPEAGGEARPMTMNEMQRYVRRLDDWQYTDNAKASASRLADAIGARFGRTA